MKLLRNAALAAGLIGLPVFAFGQPGQSQSPSPQNSQDVPQQRPGGTNNPDIGHQRQPTGTSSKDTSQKKGDVPAETPGAGHPGMRKQRQPTPKKKSTRKSTTATS